MKQDCELTQEEKEALRRLIEEPVSKRAWENKIPPPEYYMRGEPAPRRRRWVRYAVLGVLAALATGVLLTQVWKQ